MSFPIEDTRSDAVLIWVANVTSLMAIWTPALAIPTMDAAILTQSIVWIVIHCNALDR